MKDNKLFDHTEDGRGDYPGTLKTDREVIIEEVDLNGGEEKHDAHGGRGIGYFIEWLDVHAPILKIMIPVAGVLLVALVVTLLAAYREENIKKSAAATFGGSVPGQETSFETETAPTINGTGMAAQSKEDAAFADYDNALRDKELLDIEKNLAQAQDKLMSFHDMVFGDAGQSNSLGCVTAVSGFTDKEKREMGFLEADFLKDVGAFLAKQQIQTKRIIIEDRIASSSDSSIAFQGRLEGKDDFILDIIFYPDLPGEYVFLLRNIKGNERGSSAMTRSQASQNSLDQNDAQEQAGQEDAPAPNISSTQESTQQVTSPQNLPSVETAVESQNDYDATDLSVKKIPETLLNYIDNRYEFQYSLYDWMYNHGKREVWSAIVTAYSIDGDDRRATIELELSDGSSVTAVYDKSANTYSFKR